MFFCSLVFMYTGSLSSCKPQKNITCVFAHYAWQIKLMVITEHTSEVFVKVLSLLLQCLQNQSSDIRLVAERVLWWVWKEDETPILEPSMVKPLIKALLDNTKDKNTSVRAQSEHTLVSLLRLRRGEHNMQVQQHPHTL